MAKKTAVAAVIETAQAPAPLTAPVLVGPPAVLIPATSAPATASRFIAGEVVKFSRSHTRLYMALILDVIHTHGAVVPAGYAATLTALAPHITMFAKYVTIIKPALASKHAAALKDFPATVDGVSKCVTWFENQARLTGHTLSLEDSKEFFKGNLSIKAQQEALSEANARHQAIALIGRQEEAVKATVEKQVNAIARSAKDEGEQKALETAFPVVHVSSDIQPLERGPEIGAEWDRRTLVVATRGEEITVNGLQNFDAAELAALIASLQVSLASLNAAVMATA